MKGSSIRTFCRAPPSSPWTVDMPLYGGPRVQRMFSFKTRDLGDCLGCRTRKFTLFDFVYLWHLLSYRMYRDDHCRLREPDGNFYVEVEVSVFFEICLSFRGWVRDILFRPHFQSLRQDPHRRRVIVSVWTGFVTTSLCRCQEKFL